MPCKDNIRLPGSSKELLKIFLKGSVAKEEEKRLKMQIQRSFFAIFPNWFPIIITSPSMLLDTTKNPSAGPPIHTGEQQAFLSWQFHTGHSLTCAALWRVASCHMQNYEQLATDLVHHLSFWKAFAPASASIRLKSDPTWHIPDTIKFE